MNVLPITPQPSPEHRPDGSASARSEAFRRAHFPEATGAQWDDWRWQYRNRLTSPEAVARILTLGEDERRALLEGGGNLPLAITPYYASLLDPDNPEQGLRRTMLPALAEFTRLPGEMADPLGEEPASPVPGLIHRYPDRAVFLVATVCAAYCRYCNRSRMVGGTDPGQAIGRTQWEGALAYIQDHPEVRDVLISGGDPLSLSDARLEWLLTRLRAISHVEMIRIGTKMPAVLPQRITPGLVGMLRQFHPLYMSLHFNHSDEITPEAAEACGRLADAGIPLGSQTVLLKGVNDDPETMKRLMHDLLKVRVRPYYIFQCDPISGSGHFRTPVARGLEILRALRGHTSGYAVPAYVIDAPGGGGKIPLLPDYRIRREGDDLLLENFEGKTFRYHDPVDIF